MMRYFHFIDKRTYNGSSVQVLVTDILFNDIALFHFMEFMESEGQRPVVEFWMSANNFQQSVQRSGSSTII